MDSGLINRLITEKPVEAARLVNSAARLMQVYQEGLLALFRIRRGGKQTVVVQHVQVSSGGQAVPISLQCTRTRSHRDSKAMSCCSSGKQ